MKKNMKRPPRLAKYIFSGMTEYREEYSILGDVEEVYCLIQREKGYPNAYLWYWFQCFISLYRYFYILTKWSLIMFKNYFRTATRNIFKNKLNSTLNIAGLSLGIACSMIIMFHIKQELSYDRHHKNAGRIFRVTYASLSENDTRTWAATSFPLAENIKKEMPEVEETARFYYNYTRILNYKESNGKQNKFEETRGYYADPSALSIFDFTFIEGDPSTALSKPNSLILNESLAKKYFGDVNPLGKTVTDETMKTDYLVTGVIEDLPRTTHFKFKYLVSMSTYYNYMAGKNRLSSLGSAGWKALYTYILINNNQTRTGVESRLPDFVAKYFSFNGTREEVLAGTDLRLQAVTDIHLHSNIEKEMSPNSRVEYIYIFSAIAAFILIIAGVNFINITTAQAFKRTKEVGVRKVMGAQRHQLLKQFLGESLLMTFLSAAAAVLLIWLFLPVYNSFSGSSLGLMQLLTFDFVLVFVLISLFIGLAAGLYPALFMSSFKPANTLKSCRNPKSSITKMRKGLVLIQFVISIFMIFSSIIIYSQMEFFHSKDLGFDKEKLIAIRLYGDLYMEAVSDKNVLKNKLLSYPFISGVAKASKRPGDRFGMSDFKFLSLPEDKSIVNIRGEFVDEDFFETMKIELVKGKSFAGTPPDRKVFIINESAAALLGDFEPVGMPCKSYMNMQEGTIVGVMKDFNYVSLHNRIEPLVLQYFPYAANYLIIRIKGEEIAGAIDYAKKTIQEVSPGQLITYSFIDENLSGLYDSEDKISRIFSLFSFIAIFISCLGLFGLSAYSAELRIKEIGVRKSLGASSSNIVLLLSREFVLWVIAANIFALPVAWYLMNKWLQSFAYRINIGINVFIISAVMALFIALITVSYRAVKAAGTNPVDSLKYE